MIIQNILNWLREVWRKIMIGKQTIESAIQMDIAVSQPMIDAIVLWSLAYENKSFWLSDKVKSLNLPAVICTEIANLVTVEMKIKIEPEESDRAKFLDEQLKPFRKAFPDQIEFAIAKGGMVVKPYVISINGSNGSNGKEDENKDQAQPAQPKKKVKSKKRLAFEYIQADSFYPIEYGNDGEITSAVFVDQRHVGDHWYTRLEFHRWANNSCEITNQAYKSTTKEVLGKEIPLDQTDFWKDITPQATIKNCERTLFAYFKYPAANNVDTTSPLGVSAYSRALDLIQQADETWSRFLWELESSERALYVDLLAFTKDPKTNKPILPDRRLYRILDTGAEDSEFYKEFSPTIRETSYLNSLNAIYKRIESAVGLATGTLSDPNQEALTATEIVSSKQRTFSTVTGLHNSVDDFVDHLIWIMDFWVTVHKMAPSGDYEITIEFDDAVITDTAAQFQQDLLLVQAMLMSRTEFRMRNLGEDEKTAKKAIKEVDAAMPQGIGFGDEDEEGIDE